MELNAASLLHFLARCLAPAELAPRGRPLEIGAPSIRQRYCRGRGRRRIGRGTKEVEDEDGLEAAALLGGCGRRRRSGLEGRRRH